jgi:hypothetical protein
LTTTIGRDTIGFEEFDGLLMVLALSYLDYVVAVLERVERILAALAFLKCELVDNPRVEFRKQLEAYPQLLQAVMAMPIDWDARNSFLRSGDLAVNEALLWCFGWKTAHDSARQYWLKFLEALESAAM